jgi:prepilin-type N-terminal cleavage/methylation domain-containing protein
MKRNAIPNDHAYAAGCRPRRGFTLFEVILVVVVVGLIGMLAVPEFTGTSRMRLTTAANVLAADIEFCENDCITHPNDLRVIKFNTTSNTYWMALASAPDTPVSHPEDSLPYLNDFRTGRNVHLAGISISSISIGSGATSITPDAYGCPNLSADATITLTDGTYSITVTVNANTGDVTIGTAH